MKKLCLLVTVLAAPACGTVTTPTTPEPSTTTSNAVVYSAIGASDANGIGSSSPCIPYSTCPDGKGYVQEIVRRMTASGKIVTLQNLGVPGAVLSPSMQTLANQLNRGAAINFIQDEAPFVRTDSTLVTVFAGGNDANTIGSALKAGYGGSNATAWANQQIQAFVKDMATLVTAIKTRAPKARIVILNLPNLAAMPYAAGNTTLEKQILQQIAVGLSAGINATASQGAVVIDMMCDSRLYSSSIFSSDGFHPNDAGYSLFADLIYAVAPTTASTSTPKSSCSYMSLF
ncbi:MAG: SGNH/GDSL hydrolase family protein [Acidobacteria bacterium]|nr:MAG: SGNH/GDSL hydrolase family protein [Acidobacteriota bacterium]